MRVRAREIRRDLGTAIALVLLVFGAGTSVMFTQTANCTQFNLNPKSASFTAAGGGGSVQCDKGTVTNAVYTGCQWTAYTNTSWIAINPDTANSSQAGYGAVFYQVAPNTGAQRTGTIIFATSQYDSASFTVTQDAAGASTGPTITSISPSTVTAGGPAFALTITGSGLAGTAGTDVFWNSSVRLTPASVSDAQVIVTVPANYIESPGTVPVVVEVLTQFGGGIGLAKSNALPLTVVTGSTEPITPSTPQVGFQSTVVNPTLRAQDVTLSTTSGRPVLYRTIISQGDAPPGLVWLRAPASGYAPGVLTVFTDPKGLPSGSYTGTVTIAPVGSASAAGVNDAVTQDQETVVTVTLTVAEGPVVGIAPAPQLFRFTYLRGWATPDGKSLVVSPVGSQQVAFSPAAQTDAGGPWLQILPDSPTAAAHVTTWVDSGMLQGRAPGIYTGKITLTADGGSIEQVPISARVLDNPDSAVPINYTPGSAAPVLPSVPFHANDGQATPFVADAASDGGWLSITPSSGISGPGATIQPSINAGALQPGVHKGYYAVTAALNPTDAVVVGLTVTVAPPANTAPTIQQVANAGSYGPQIAPNTFIMVKGTGLANVSDPKNWGQAPEIARGELPQSLFGVRVLVNNKPAYISYLSATQINALLPITASTGNVTVQVDNNGSPSNAVTVPIQNIAPAFFMFDGRHIATTRGNGGIVAPLGQYPGSSPAKPGEMITFWGTGFGSTNPGAPDGVVLTQAYRSTETPRIFFGSQEATVDWAGLSATGLFQINLRVPDTTPEGEIAVTATVGGQSTQVGVTIPVKP